MINDSTERGLQHIRSCMVYTSLPWFRRAAYTHSVQSQQDTWSSLHTDVVFLKKMKIFGRVFIMSEADTFATLAFQASEWAEGFESHY